VKTVKNKKEQVDYVIIVAGGKGLRMGSDIPKQFLPVGGKPILMRTISRFREYSLTLGIVLVLPREQHEYWLQLCHEYDFTEHCTLACGGETRFHSVRNGLVTIPDDDRGVVGVHDGVRPFPSVDVIRRCYDRARMAGSAIPVAPVVDTLRHICPQGYSETVPRGDFRLVQTPQVFDLQLLKQAYSLPYRDSFTDDASVVEALGHKVELVEGNCENIKITTPFDLHVAEVLAE